MLIGEQFVSQRDPPFAQLSEQQNVGMKFGFKRPTGHS
jgi:hypothetical protein